MHSHPLARLTPISRERLIQLHIDQGIPLLDLAVQAGISLRTAYKWLARFRQGEVGAFYWTVLAPDIVNPGREERVSIQL